MGNFLRHIIVALISAFALVSCTAESNSSIIESQANALPCKTNVHYLYSSTPNLDLHLPRQVTGINNIVQTPNILKRVGNGHKNNAEFVKVGKVINVCTGNSIQQESSKNNPCHTKSASLLITLGKLII